MGPRNPLRPLEVDRALTGLRTKLKDLAGENQALRLEVQHLKAENARLEDHVHKLLEVIEAHVLIDQMDRLDVVLETQTVRAPELRELGEAEEHER